MPTSDSSAQASVHWIVWLTVGLGCLVLLMMVTLGRPGETWERLALARASSQWPHTTATEFAIWVDTEVQGGRSSSSWVDHTVMARYDYQVAGQNYTGERVRFADMSLRDRVGKQLANGIAERLRTQAPHLVTYNPDDPSQAVLEPGLHRQNLWEIFNLVLWLLLALALFGLAGWLGSPSPRKT